METFIVDPPLSSIMQKARFLDPAGTVRFGELTGESLEASGRTYSIDDVELLPPSKPTKIICVGLNYHDHIEEGSYDEVPDIPMLFLKPPNCLAAHNDTIRFPVAGHRYDPEAEIGVVIGEQCRNLTQDTAMDVVAGFTCGNDLSNRDDQYMEMERKWNFVRGKAFDNAAPLGPCLADPEDVPQNATIELRVNGETRQQSSRDNMVFTIPEILEEITTYMTLEPGDVILTGTPAGIESLEDGDVVEVELEGVGTLRNTVHVP